MWCSSIRSGLAVLGSAPLAVCSLASSAAHAQQRDEAWVVSQVVAGKFDELRLLEKLGHEGVPFAMYWRGIMLERCIFERCDKAAGKALVLRAALGGHGRAQAHILVTAETRAEFDDLVARIGMPASGREPMVYLARSLQFIQTPAFLGGTPKPNDDKLRAELLGIAKREPQVGTRVLVAVQEGHSSGELDVLAEAGISLIAELMMQRAYVRQISDRQIIERARAGELGLAAAYCNSLMVHTGRMTMDRNELEFCERAAQAGFPGAVLGLLTHHHSAGNSRAAEYFAVLCEEVPGVGCGNPIVDYYYDRSQESPELKAKWELWDLAAANMLSATIPWPSGVTEEELRGNGAAAARTLCAPRSHRGDQRGLSDAAHRRSRESREEPTMPLAQADCNPGGIPKRSKMRWRNSLRSPLRPWLPGSSSRLFRDAHHRGFWAKQLEVAWDQRPDHRTRRARLHLQYSCAAPCGLTMLETQGTLRP